MNRKLALILAACVSLAPIALQAQIRILPFGDSVTSSFAPYSSYRYWLWHELQNKGYDIDFVGTQFGVTGGTPDKTDFDQDHDGHPGWTSQDALANAGSIALATQPDIVLLDFGGNDVADGIPLDVTVANLRSIIDDFRDVNPNVVVVLAQSTPYEGQDKRGMSKLREAIRRLAKKENRSDSRVKSVNLNKGFRHRKHTFDGTHPNEAGERKIAKKHFSKLKKLLR